eukprot:c22061_g1_i1 orf=343-1476(+)
MTSSHTVFVILAIFAFWHACKAQQCNTLFTFNGSPVNFTKCAALPTQGAMLAWTFYEDNSTLSIAFAGTAPSSSGWVGWGINPDKPGTMVGSSALIAFSARNGSNVLPYKLTSAVQFLTEPLTCSPVDLVIETTAVEIQGTSMSFFAALRLPPNKTTLNHIWNRGSGVLSFQPQQHGLSAADLLGSQSIDMYTAQTIAGGGPPRQSLKRTHGIINTISWGILLPLGVMLARYLRPFSDSVWFYIHVLIQTLGYVLGVTGWALGMRLRAVSAYVHRSHQDIGIALFVIATVQVFALILRPNKDQKVRRYWNYYHHSLGYAIILLAIINIFQGLNILAPGGHWRSGYIASLCLMAVVAVVLEVVMWIRYFKQRKEEGLP